MYFVNSRDAVCYLLLYTLVSEKVFKYKSKFVVNPLFFYIIDLNDKVCRKSITNFISL